MASSLGSCLAGTLYRMDFELSLFLLRGETRKTPGKTTTRWMVDPGGKVERWLGSCGGWKLWMTWRGILDWGDISLLREGSRQMCNNTQYPWNRAACLILAKIMSMMLVAGRFMNWWVPVVHLVPTVSGNLHRPGVTSSRRYVLDGSSESESELCWVCKSLIIQALQAVIF